jgi:hypothetical protein
MALTVGTNSYVTAAEVASYFTRERVYYDNWEEETDDNEKALIQAARLLEYQMNWLYEKTDSDQIMQWPRTGFADIDTDAIPQAVKYAQMELAIELKKNDQTSFLESAGFNYLKIENIAIKINTNQNAQVIPDHVFAYISHIGGRKDGTGSLKRIR